MLKRQRRPQTRLYDGLSLGRAVMFWAMVLPCFVGVMADDTRAF
jgi:hypothetical protein